LARLFAIVLVVMLGLPCVSHAAIQEVRSCYDAIPMPGIRKPLPKRELYVLVDQTVLFSSELQREAMNRIVEFLTPGDKVTLVSFSAYARGRYTTIDFEGLLDTGISDDERFYIGKNLLRLFDKCLEDQRAGVQLLVIRNLQQMFGRADLQLPNTELIGTLFLLAKQMRPIPHAKRYLFIISDMLEHSGITSFYSAGRLRQLDPAHELSIVESLRLFPDFQGANVYVLGAAASLGPQYESAIKIEALETFWREYFAASHGTLRVFGTPSLLQGMGSE